MIFIKNTGKKKQQKQQQDVYGPYGLFLFTSLRIEIRVFPWDTMHLNFLYSYSVDRKNVIVFCVLQVQVRVTGESRSDRILGIIPTSIKEVVLFGSGFKIILQ